MEARQRFSSFIIIFILGPFVIQTVSALECRNCVESTGLPGCMSFDQLQEFGLNIRNYGTFSNKMARTNPVVCLKYTMSFSMRGVQANVVIRSGLSQSIMGSELDQVFQIFGEGSRRTRTEGGMICSSATNVDLASMSNMVGGGISRGSSILGNAALGGIQVNKMEFCECSTDSCNDPNPPAVSSGGSSFNAGHRDMFDSDELFDFSGETRTTTEDVPFDFSLDSINNSPSLGYRKYGQVAVPSPNEDGQQGNVETDNNNGTAEFEQDNNEETNGLEDTENIVIMSNGSVSTIDTASAPSPLTMTEHMELMKAQLDHLEQYVHDIGSQISRNTIILGSQAGIAWGNNNGRHVPQGSLAAGEGETEIRGNFGATRKNLHVARAWMPNGDLLVGKHLDRADVAHIPYNGTEFRAMSFQTLIVPATDVVWIPLKNGKGKHSLAKVIVGGVQKDGQSIFIGRTVFKNEWAVGSVRPDKKLYVAHGYEEHAVTQNFEILALKDQ